MSREQITVRAATPADLAAICAIYNHEVRSSTSTFELEDWTPASRREWLESHQSPKHPLLVAEAGAGVLGWASLSPWSPKAGYARTVEASVFVDPEHRRRGIASRLMAALLAAAREAGHRVVLARIEASNGSSRKLLSGLDFQSVGVMHAVGEKLGRVLDVELLELLLRERPYRLRT